MKRLISALFCVSVFWMNAATHAAEIAGQKIDETIQVSGSTLKLNGAGVRKKELFNLRVEYVVALYLQETRNTVEGVLRAAGSKQINLTMVHEISSKNLRQAFKDVDKRNLQPAERARLSNQFRQFDQLFLSMPGLKAGDVISMEWVPDVGANILINGEKIGETFAGKGFFDALLLIWLGEKPVDATLKLQLLDMSAESSVQTDSEK